jgi:hypothetical protein
MQRAHILLKFAHLHVDTIKNGIKIPNELSAIVLAIRD